MQISIEGIDPEARVFVRDGDGAWVALQSDSGESSFCAGERYDITSICPVFDGLDDGVVAEQFLMTSAATRIRLTACGPSVAEAPYTVSGQMTRPGSVTVGGQRVSRNNSPWRFAVGASAGTHTVFASTMLNDFHEGPQTFLVLPDLVVDRDVDVGTIDLDIGHPSEPLDVSVFGAEPGTELSMRVSATFKDGTHARISRTNSTPAWVLPPVLRAHFEEERITVYASGDTFSQGLARATSAGMELHLPPRWSDAVIESREGRAVATWSSLPLAAYDRVSFGDNGGPSGGEYVVVTRSRIEQQQLTTLTFDGSVPGYQRSFASSTSSLLLEQASDSGEYQWTSISASW